MKQKYIHKIAVISILTSMALSTINYAESTENQTIQLIVDGKNITKISEPIMESNRVLVPLKFLSEEIGAEVSWNGEDRTVTVTKDNKSMLLWVDSRLVQYNGGADYGLIDIAPKIINDHVYVPLRLVSNGLSTGIQWDGENKEIHVDSDMSSEVVSSFDMEMTNVSPGGTISEKVNISLFMGEAYKDKGQELNLLLLNPDTARGFIVAREGSVTSSINYLPKVEDKGNKVLVAVLYDENRKIIAGDAVPVYIDVQPKVTITGVTSQVTSNSITLGQELNFLAKSVAYEFTSIDTGEVTTISQRDPAGTYKWKPSDNKEGAYSMRVIAYDGDGIAYSSNTANTTFVFEEYLSLSGVKTGSTVTKPVMLIASRNFDVIETEYLIRDYGSTNEILISKIPYGGYTWTPTQAMSGDKELYVRVKDIYGKTRTSAPVRVTVDATPQIYLHGVGPNQVLTGDATLSVSSNVIFDSVNYVLTDKKSGNKKYLGKGMDPDEKLVFTPSSSDDGGVMIQAVGVYQGKTLLTEEISFKVYMGTLYGPKAIVEKDKFLGFASNLATDSFNKTGMSASLQTAQAILETGWGQRLPVDKYSGKFSYNLFGIKGSSSNGSVVSNTWEVYNGTKFRVDANFRAYNNVNESWADHKRILLELSRYEPYREVMYDSTLGAWAIRRAGYATDPKYPVKLMNIIEQYDLRKLDEVGVGM